MAGVDKNKLIESANKFIARNQPDKAIKELQRVLELEPKNTQIALKIAELFLKLNNKEEAIKHYEIASNIFRDSGFYDKAIAVFRQILTLNPVSAQAYIKLAELFRKKNLIAEAVSNYKVAIAIYEKEGKPQEALKILQTITELEPSNLPGRMKLAELYIKNGLKEQAYTELSRIANKLIEARRVVDLITVYEKMLSIKPGEISIIKELIKLYLSRGDYQKVLLKVKDIIASGNSDTDVLLALAKAYTALDKIPHAISAYKEVAKLYSKAGLEDEADNIYKKILELDPTDQQALQKVVKVKVEPQPVEEIIPQPIETKEEKPKIQVQEQPAKPPETFVEKEKKQVVEQRKPVVEPATQISSVKPEVEKKEKPSTEEIEKLFSEAEVYKRYGLSNKAEEKFKQILEISPHNRKALISLFEIYEASKRFSEASGLAEKLYNELIADGEIEKAEDFVKRAIANDPGNEVLKALIGYTPEEEKPSTEFEELKPHEEPPVSVEVPVEEKRVEPPPSPTQQQPVEAPYNQEIPSTSEETEVSQQIDTGIEIEVEPSAPPPEASAEEVNVEIPVVNINEQAQEEKIAGEQVKEEVPIPDQINFAPELTEEREEVNVTADQKQVQEDEIGISFSEEEFETGKEDYIPQEEKEKPPIIEKEEKPLDIDIVDALDEAEFYYQQGILSEAKEILQKVLKLAPNEQRAKDRLAEILAREEASKPQVESIPSDLDESFIQKEADHVVVASSDEGLFDLAQELEKELAVSSITQEVQQPSEEEQQISVEEVLEAFKKGVEKSVDKQDAETHYNLGIAYKEMGLLDEAINEFNIATLSPEKKADGLIMLGMSYMGKGLPGKAIEMYKQALEAKGGIKPENIGLLYEFAIAYEAYGDMQNAYNYYDEVRKIDEGFREVKVKLEQLKKFIEEQSAEKQVTDEQSEKFTLDSLLKEEDLIETPEHNTREEKEEVIVSKEQEAPIEVTKFEEPKTPEENMKQDKVKPAKKKVSYI
ncbi:MAG: tetratricopeptide repeat protein [bacterium]